MDGRWKVDDRLRINGLCGGWLESKGKMKKKEDR